MSILNNKLVALREVLSVSLGDGGNPSPLGEASFLVSAVSLLLKSSATINQLVKSIYTS